MKELWIDLQPDSPRALYEQIYEYIRKDIADGKISPGEKLPSTRFMAKNLQISRSTVELAYEQLTAEGYIEPKPCRLFCMRYQHAVSAEPWTGKARRGKTHGAAEKAV